MKTESKLALAMGAILLPAFMLAGCSDEVQVRTPDPQAPITMQIEQSPEAYGYTVLFNRNGCEFGRYIKPGFKTDNTYSGSYIYTVTCPQGTASATNANGQQDGKNSYSDVRVDQTIAPKPLQR